MEIRDAIREERECSVCLLNYRKDKTPFWNAFYMAPIRGPSGCVDYYVGIQSDVTALITSGREICEASVRAVGEEESAAAQRIAHDMERQAAALLAASAKWQSCAIDSSVPSSLLTGLGRIREAFVLADPSLPDCPMVYCSPAFLKLTGYCCHELVGHNCRMLQGPGTDPTSVQRIRDALAAGKPVTETLINYKKSGVTFVNCLHIAPIRDADGKVKFFCGVQAEVTGGNGAAGKQTAAEALRAPSGGEEASVHASVPQPDPLQVLRQKGVVGAVRVASRALSVSGLRRTSTNRQPMSPPAV